MCPSQSHPIFRNRSPVTNIPPFISSSPHQSSMRFPLLLKKMHLLRHCSAVWGLGQNAGLRGSGPIEPRDVRYRFPFAKALSSTSIASRRFDTQLVMAIGLSCREQSRVTIRSLSRCGGATDRPALKRSSKDRPSSFRRPLSC